MIEYYAQEATAAAAVQEWAKAQGADGFYPPRDGGHPRAFSFKAGSEPTGTAWVNAGRGYVECRGYVAKALSKRPTGKKLYLPGKPGDPEFAEAYACATQGLKKVEPGAGRTKPGTINALAVAFYASAEWRQLKPATQKHYRGTIERLRASRGDFGVRGFQPRHVLDLRDRMADRPAAANNLVKVLRALMDFAVARGWRPDDPTAGIKALKLRLRVTTPGVRPR